MLADSIDAREADLSHLSAQVAYAFPPEASQAAKKSLRYLVIGTAISFSLHAIVLLINWRQDSFANKKMESPTLMIQLQSIKPEPVVEQPVTPAKQDVATPIPDVIPAPLKDEGQINTPSEVQSSPSKIIVVQPLTADELRDVIQRNSTGSVVAPTRGVAANVFHPGMRQRLQEEERKPDLQRVDAGPKTYTDPSGATIVDLGSGKCLRSSIPQGMEAQNWYMTSCGGKSESERAMERVDQTVNGKLRLE